MTAFSHSAFLQALGWAVLNSIWQMAFLWIIYNVGTSLPKNMRSAHKSAIATALLFSGFAWFILTFISLYINRGNNNAIITLSGLSQGQNETMNNWLNMILPFASVIYIMLLAVPLLRFTKSYRYAQVLKKHNRSKMDVEWRMFVRRVAAQIGIKKQVLIWVSGLVTSPVTIGYLKPVILVPLASMNNLTSQQMEAVLLHELAHIKRYDYLLNLFVNFIRSVLYFNPFVKAFAKTIECERERSCDEMVIQFQYDPHNYAAALLALEKSNTIAHEMAIAAAGKNDLLNRIERILNIDSKPVFTFNKLAGLLAGLFCIILLNALVVVNKPASPHTDSFVFDRLATPFLLFSNEDEKPAVQNEPARKEIQTPSIVNTAAPVKNNNKSEKDDPAAILLSLSEPAPPAVTGVNAEVTIAPSFSSIATVQVPELNKREIKLVEQTVEATKKIVMEVQWKEVEKNIADVMTSLEKEKVKAQYEQELEKMNWEKLENKLKTSYDQLNWDKINEQVGTAMLNIQLDSLVRVYSIAKENLERAEKLAATPGNSIASEIPLPDVSVESIKERRELVQKNLVKLKALRSKKIIHL